MVGQLCLKKASVLLVGVGGLGCPAAAYIAGAGIGTIGLVDGDVVEASNLHRQIVHTTSRVGKMKVDSAISYLKEQALRPSPCRFHRYHITYRPRGHPFPQPSVTKSIQLVRWWLSV